MKTTLLAALCLMIHGGACDAGEPEGVPDPINESEIALLLGIHKFQVRTPADMIGGPAFMKVFYVHPDGAETEIGGVGSAKSGELFEILLREPAGTQSFKVVTKTKQGGSTLEKELDHIGKPQQWFSERIARDGDTLGVFWGGAKIIVRFKAVANPVWEEDENEPEKKKDGSIPLGPETARLNPRLD